MESSYCGRRRWVKQNELLFSVRIRTQRVDQLHGRVSYNDNKETTSFHHVEDVMVDVQKRTGLGWPEYISHLDLNHQLHHVLCRWTHMASVSCLVLIL